MNELQFQKAESKPPRVLLVGTGDAARHHARALVELQDRNMVEWTSTVARNYDSYKQFCSDVGRHDFGRFYTSIDSALSKAWSSLDLYSDDAGNFDIAILATPDHTHYDQIRDCLDSGIAVLTEKPFVQTVEQAKDVVALAQRNDRLLRAGYHHRHHKGHIALKQTLAPLGRIDHIEMSWSWHDPNRSGWRASSEGDSWAVAALGTHMIDFASWLTNEPFVVERAELSPNNEPELYADINGRVGETTVHMTTNVEESKRSIVRIYGEIGTVACDGTFGPRGTGRIQIGSPFQLDYPVKNPYVAQLESFVTDYRNGFENDDTLVGNVAVLERIKQMKKEA